MQKYKPYKKTEDYSYTLGIYPTIELLTSRPQQVEVVILAPHSEHSSGIQKIRNLCQANNITVEVNEKAITRLARSDNSYAIGVFKKYTDRIAADKPHVVLVQPDDSGNVGTILRTMLGFGHRDLAIISPAVDVFDPRVIRASMGAFFKQRAQYFASIEEYRAAFSTHHLYPFLLETDTLLGGVAFERPYSLVFGNEGSGLPGNYKHIGTSLRIEQSQDVDSLNLAVAASVALYKAYATTK